MAKRWLERRAWLRAIVEAGGRPTDAHVALAILEWLFAAEDVCRPSHAELRAVTGLSDRSLGRSVARLVQAGALESWQGVFQGKRGVSRYRPVWIFDHEAAEAVLRPARTDSPSARAGRRSGPTVEPDRRPGNVPAVGPGASSPSARAGRPESLRKISPESSPDPDTLSLPPPAGHVAEESERLASMEPEPSPDPEQALRVARVVARLGALRTIPAAAPPRRAMTADQIAAAGSALRQAKPPTTGRALA